MILGRNCSTFWLNSLKNVLCAEQDFSVTVESCLLHVVLGLDTQLRTGNFSPVCSQSPLAGGPTLLGGEVLCTLGWLGWQGSRQGDEAWRRD